MVAPITGPLYEFPTYPFANAYKMRYRQTKPYDRPLAYRAYYNYGKYATTSGNQFGQTNYVEGKEADFSASSVPGYSSRASHAYNRAYEKLRGKLSDRAGWSENIAQINKTRSTIVDRSVQLWHFTKAVKDHRFRDAARILRTPLPSAVSNRKAVSQNFIEYEYGVKPLISDLVSSWGILTEADFGDRYLKGTARETYSDVVLESTPNYGNGGYFRQRTKREVHIVRRASCLVRVINPNVFLANQLGLIDLALPWKLMPFSFVADWFVNFEQCISSVTDWYGVTMTHPTWTKYDYGSFERTTNALSYQSHDTKPPAYTWSNSVRNKSFYDVERYLGLPGPSLTVRPFRGFSVQRGAQAIALVLAVFGK